MRSFPSGMQSGRAAAQIPNIRRRDEGADAARTVGVHGRAMPQTPSWTLIVLRAWADIDGLRIRVLGTDSVGGQSEIVVASAEDAAGVVRAWLRDFAATQDVTRD